MRILKVEGEDGSYFVRRDGERIVLGTVSGDPMPLLPGWTPLLAFVGPGATCVLQLQHQNGSPSIWFMDDQFRFQTNSFAELPPHEQDALRSELVAPATAVWLRCTGNPSAELRGKHCRA